ncbi:Lipocalin-like domain-containing protein [Sphingomonas laterariae]|uniref:Lipocalin-like domain-containing protein n=1 Tax=Edaphosphingomonas laterariae TaxID=861865 RepID=A0A239DV09_9SPHN|nr:lipocalin-like domain-containing protein [Sphingomonas laterariae]SNS35434.1 Lipocalin-like domain-containing protein [Sphingomonas laterariae]
MTIASRRYWLKALTVAMPVLALMPGGPAMANEAAATALPRLIGTWQLVSYELHDGKGGVIHPMGAKAQGQIIYDAAGNMSCHLLNPNPPARPSTVADGATYEARVSYDRYSSYYGPYDVDTGRHEVSHHVLGATMPGWAGTTVVRNYAFEGDGDLTLSADIGTGGQRAVLKWRRAR